MIVSTKLCLFVYFKIWVFVDTQSINKFDIPKIYIVESTLITLRYTHICKNDNCPTNYLLNVNQFCSFFKLS